MTISGRLAALFLVLSTAACGGAGEEVDAESDDLTHAHVVVVAIEDDGDVHATGLRGNAGEAWDHFVKKGDRIRLENRSSNPAFVTVMSSLRWTDGRLHKASRFEMVLDRELPASHGSFSWTVKDAALSFSIQIKGQESHIVSEPDGSSSFPAGLDVR